MGNRIVHRLQAKTFLNLLLILAKCNCSDIGTAFAQDTNIPSGEIKAATHNNASNIDPVSNALKRAWNKSFLPVGATDFNSPSRFIGFVEGRLQVEPPAWWARFVNKVDMNAGYERYDRGDMDVYSKNKDRFSVSANVNVRLSDHNVEVEVDGVQFGCERKLANGMPVEIISGLVMADSVYVLLASQTPCGSKLVKINRERQEVWSADVLGDFVDSHSGRPFHFVEPVVNDIGQLVVFGGGANSIYIEVFDAGSGECLARFVSGTASGKGVAK